MQVKYKKFPSDSSPNTADPWYEVAVRNGEVVITNAKDADLPNGIRTARTTLPGEVDFPSQRRVSRSGDVTYAITENGNLISYDPNDESADIPPLLAHVGYYDSRSDTLTLLDFVEKGTES